MMRFDEGDGGELENKIYEAHDIADCTCYQDCRKCSHSGEWHQHDDEPCPVHPDQNVVG